ncbi:Solute carrier family 43 member 3, partial [Schistosoma japonicum]
TQLDSCLPHNIRPYVGLILGILDLFLFGGYYYGFNSLIGIYKSLGLFSYNCTQYGCMYDDNMFGISFNVWIVTQMCLITLAGIFMDKVGLRPLKIVSALLYAAGTVMFAFTTGKVAPLFFIAGILVALSSICSLMCNHQISSMLPQIPFDSSTVVAYVISKNHAHFSLQWSFVSLAIGSLIMGIFIALFVLSKKSVDMAKFARVNEKESIFRSRHQYALINYGFFLGLFRFAMFLSQLYKQLVYLFPTDQQLVDHLLEVSSVFSMCGFLVAPISGLIIDLSLRRTRDKVANMLINSKFNLSNKKMYIRYICGLVPALIIMSIFAIILSAMMFIPNKTCYLYSICLFGYCRSLLFPIRYFGTLNGISSAIAGLFSLLQHIFLHTSGFCS